MKYLLSLFFCLIYAHAIPISLFCWVFWVTVLVFGSNEAWVGFALTCQGLLVTAAFYGVMGQLND